MRKLVPVILRGVSFIEKGTILICWYVYNILLFVTKFCMVVHHHEVEYFVMQTKWVCLQGQGHSEGLYNENKTV